MRELQAFLYLQEAEQMPEDASDQWFLQPQPQIELVLRYQDLVNGLNYILNNISDQQTEEELQAVFYDAGKLFYGVEKTDLRMFFRGLYQIILQRPSGPRWGQFVTIMTVDNFRLFVQERLSDPLTVNR